MQYNVKYYCISYFNHSIVISVDDTDFVEALCKIVCKTRNVKFPTVKLVV